jgi:tRNA (adenine57-N1/adenine58-N1)-methyltransferase
MLPRDVGLVVGETGVAAGDRVLDAGTGTGVLAGYLGRLGVEVITYERDPEFAEVARENMALAGVDDRVEVRSGDVLEGLDSHSGFDAVTLDTEDAPPVVERVPEALADGGFLAVYSPFVEATREVVEAARERLSNVRAIETIQRELDSLMDTVDAPEQDELQTARNRLLVAIITLNDQMQSQNKHSSR